MKFLLRCGITVFVIGTLAQAQTTFNLIMALSGGEQNPSVTTNGYGYGWGTLDLNQHKLTYAVAYDSLSGPPTAAHFHLGAQGVNGSPIHSITFDTNGVAMEEWTDIPDTTLAHILMGRVYCNIHTAAHSGGEIRGQLQYVGPFTFPIFATAANQVPALTEKGEAVGFALYSSGIFSVYGVYKGLTGPPTGMHIHYGGAGQSGTVAIPVSHVGSLISGAGAMPNDSSFRLLLSSNLYFNIHTTAHSGGEIRGQLNGTRFYPFYASMDGAQSVPSNASEAKGLFVTRYDVMKNQIEYGSQITGVTPTGAHIHAGAPGENGNVMIPLNYSSTGYTETKDVGVTPADSVLRLFCTLGAYVNVHSAAFSGGEIRGQILPAYNPVSIAFLDSAQQVPETNSAGTGAALFSFGPGQEMMYSLVVDGLTGPASAAHIHAGAPGQGGSPVIPLTVNVLDETVADVSDTTMIQLLRGGSHYVNVHTAAFSGGEIRGDIFAVDGSGDNGPTTVKSKNTGGTIPQAFVLEQNYPNPFNPATTINYQLPVNAAVTVKVYDLVGREVATLVNAEQAAGKYSVHFNASELSSGMYFYQLKAGTSVSTKKMMLLK